MRIPFLNAGITALALLLAPMTATAASRDSGLSLRLSDAIGLKAWPEKVSLYHSVKLVTYNCDCRVGGFVFIDSQSRLITQRDIFQTMQLDIDYNAVMHSHHSQVLLTRGENIFHGVVVTSDGGQRFLFTQLVSECEACEPFTAIRFAFDFDAKGIFQRAHTLGYINVQDAAHGISPPMEQ